MKARKKLLHLLWWRDLEASKQSSGTVSLMEWNDLTEDEYDSFRSVHAANRARGNGTVGKGVTDTNTVTQEKVVAFQKGHNRDPSSYTKFNDQRRGWFRVKRNWCSNPRNDGIGALLSASYIVPTDGTEAKSLFDAQSGYFYNALQAAVTAGQAMILLRNHEQTNNGHDAYLEIVNFYERKANLSLISTDCQR